MTECINWTGSCTRRGYGRAWHEGRMMSASKAAWIKAHGPVPAGLCICHTCDNPRCVNLDHLFLGTHGDNMRDKVLKGRQARGSRQGHARLTEETAVCAMARLLAGESQTSVARAFGVHKATICYLWQGKTWSHLFQRAF